MIAFRIWTRTSGDASQDCVEGSENARKLLAMIPDAQLMAERPESSVQSNQEYGMLNGLLYCFCVIAVAFRGAWQVAKRCAGR